MLPHDRVIEHLLRWNIFVMLLLGTIHYFTDGWFFDLIELPIVFFFFIGKLLSIPQIWVTLLVVFSVRYLKN